MWVMKFDEFVRLVRSMRDAQLQLYKGDRSKLPEVLRLEREVDRLLERGNRDNPKS